jgi:hypothetical protein
VKKIQNYDLLSFASAESKIKSFAQSSIQMTDISQNSLIFLGMPIEEGQNPLMKETWAPILLRMAIQELSETWTENYPLLDLGNGKSIDEFHDSFGTLLSLKSGPSFLIAGGDSALSLQFQKSIPHSRLVTIGDPKRPALAKTSTPSKKSPLILHFDTRYFHQDYFSFAVPINKSGKDLLQPHQIAERWHEAIQNQGYPKIILVTGMTSPYFPKGPEPESSLLTLSALLETLLLDRPSFSKKS